jgi:hypothetical protein
MDRDSEIHTRTRTDRETRDTRLCQVEISSDRQDDEDEEDTDS